jgi:hypothetical protein
MQYEQVFWSRALARGYEAQREMLVWAACSNLRLLSPLRRSNIVDAPISPRSLNLGFIQKNKK